MSDGPFTLDPQVVAQAKPAFIHPHESDKSVFHCTHSEANGMFVMQKLTLGRQAWLERLRGEYAGAMPTLKGDQLAARLATLHVGFEKTPEDFNPEDLQDSNLVEALYGTLVSYWEGFSGFSSDLL